MEATYRAMSPSELATLAVQMERDQLREAADPGLPEAQAALLPCASRRGWRPGRSVDDGIEPFEAALAGRAHGWQLREISRSTRRQLGRQVTRALAGVYTAPSALDAQPRRGDRLVLWVFRTPASARTYIDALREAGQEANLVAGRENLVITGSDATRARDARSLVIPWLADLLGPEPDSAST